MLYTPWLYLFFYIQNYYFIIIIIIFALRLVSLVSLFFLKKILYYLCQLECVTPDALLRGARHDGAAKRVAQRTRDVADDKAGGQGSQA